MSLAKGPRLQTLSHLLRQSRQPLSKPCPLHTRAITTKRSITLHTRCVPLVSSSSARLLSRSFHQSAARLGIMPDAENPPVREAEDMASAQGPADITYDEYHQLADEYLDRLLNRLEEMQEGRSDVEVEYAAGVLTVEVANKGTYVLNKQPPNKQIWLSSPIAGPKRYDWVVSGDSMHHKEGGGQGDWIYLRDGSTLTQLLKKEIGVNLEEDETIA